MITLNFSKGKLITLIFRFYKKQEIKIKLPKLLDYYENYSKIFPNYIVLHEAKYLYKNIQRKQKIIDNIQLHEYKKKNKDGGISILSHEDVVFNTEVYNSILNLTVSVCQSHKENSIMMKQKGKLERNDSKDSLENLISRIGWAEEGKAKHRAPMLGTGISDVSSMERKTIEVSGTNKGLKIEGGLVSKTRIGSKDMKVRPKIVSELGLKSIKDKLTEGIYRKHDGMSTLYGKSSKFIKNDGGVASSQVFNGNHKATQSMPKLTNNLFSILHQNNTANNTIYQSIKKNSSKNTNFSPTMVRDLNLTGAVVASKGNFLRTSNEKKKSYKKLLRPELLSDIGVNEVLKKTPYEIPITKVQSTKAARYLEGDSKHSRDYNFTRNVSSYC
jgi:hypothetical protein